MIENAVAPATRTKEFIPVVPEFGSDSPHANPFIIPMSLKLRQYGQHVSWDFQYHAITKPMAPVRGEVAEGLLSKTLQAAKRFPNSARALANAGSAFLCQGALEKSSEYFAAALENDSRHCVALGGLARVRMLQGNLDAAEDLYRRLAAENPDDASPLIGLPHVAVKRHRLEDAVSFLQSAVQANSNRLLAEYHLALVLLRANRNREAIGHLRSALREEDRWPAMHEVLAIAYVLAGNLRKAEKEFRTALKLVPSNKRAAHELAEVLYRLGDNSEAINVLHASLARDPADPEAREILARTYEKDAAFKQARQELLEAAPFIDESNTEQRGRVFNNIGVCTSLLDRTHLAAQWFAKSIDSAPSASAVPYLNAARE